MPGAADKRPESVLVIVAARTGEVLVLTRRQPAGFRQSVTGSLAWGESAWSAAVRELGEETGLSAEGLIDLEIGARFRIRPEWRARFGPGVRENVEHWFLLWVDAPVPVRLSPEHTEASWMPLQQALRSIDSWTNRLAIERYLQD
ncbi:MAG TPA: dihydroneopterin triphosphate diphosphatase [Gammaproteobacteria bacterium]|nr:dihydroneopterin triphosphate diphosphatase [Gammaproteobacteria bacterium]